MDITKLLDFSVKHNASDLHLSVGVVPMVRVDGDLKAIDAPILNHQCFEQMLVALCSEKERLTLAEIGYLDVSIDWRDLGRFRVSFFYKLSGYGAVFRIIPQSIPKLDGLVSATVFEHLTALSEGMVLVTGPTGSGKSTTLAALIEYINLNQSKHIVTLEDPVEYVYHSQRSLITQRTLRPQEQSFEQVLQSVLRVDPDVIVVGELRSEASIRFALTAAETGHLVLATLHTRSAAQTIERIIDANSGPSFSMTQGLLANCLQMIITQRLLKRTEGGRVACYEVLRATQAIRNLIREGKHTQIHSVMQLGHEHGMQTFAQHATYLVSEGVVSSGEAKPLMLYNRV